MKKWIWAVILLIVVSAPDSAWARRELLDQVIAVVNDEPVTQSELDVLLRPLYDQFREEYRGEELVVKLNEARQKLLNQLIEDRLVYQEAVNQKIEVDPSEVDRAVAEFRKRFPSEIAMEEVLREQGLALTDLKERFRRQAMIRQLHNIEIRSKVVVSPKEIEEFYQKSPEKFSSRERLKTRSITVKKSYETRENGTTDEVAKKKIADIRARILAGQDFASLAKESSEDVHAEKGGLSDWVERGTMIPVINDVIFALKLGEISEVIETPMGYHLFRVEEKEQGSQKSLEEVRDQIFEELFRQKGDERFYDWMQELKKNAYISIR